MSLKHGQNLSCGCVVGEYWCDLHDIYARRDKPTSKWTSDGKGGYTTRLLQPNNHRPLSDFQPIPTEYVEPRGCSCHIMPPCSFCAEKGDEE